MVNDLFMMQSKWLKFLLFPFFILFITVVIFSCDMNRRDMEFELIGNKIAILRF